MNIITNIIIYVLQRLITLVRFLDTFHVANMQ